MGVHDRHSLAKVVIVPTRTWRVSTEHRDVSGSYQRWPLCLLLQTLACARGIIRCVVQMLMLSCVTRQDVPHVPLQEMGISIRPLDTHCLIATCKVPANSPCNLPSHADLSPDGSRALPGPALLQPAVASETSNAP